MLTVWYTHFRRQSTFDQRNCLDVWARQIERERERERWAAMKLPENRTENKSIIMLVPASDASPHRIRITSLEAIRCQTKTSNCCSRRIHLYTGASCGPTIHMWTMWVVMPCSGRDDERGELTWTRHRRGEIIRIQTYSPASNSCVFSSFLFDTHQHIHIWLGFCVDARLRVFHKFIFRVGIISFCCCWCWSARRGALLFHFEYEM